MLALADRLRRIGRLRDEARIGLAILAALHLAAAAVAIRMTSGPRTLT
jgi:hypothetical protein